MTTRSLPERVSALKEAVSALQHLPQELAAFRVEVNARFDQVNAWFERIDRRFEQIDRRFERIDAQFERVYSQMRMLHEDLVDRIKALGEGRAAGATRRNRGTACFAVAGADTSERRKPCVYCNPDRTRDAVSRAPDAAALDTCRHADMRWVRRWPADYPHVRPLRSRISRTPCGAARSQYKHGSFGLSHPCSRPGVANAAKGSR